MQRVNFHLTDEQLAWLRGRQESTGVPAAEQIRRAIDRERAMTKTITKQERNQAVRCTGFSRRPRNKKAPEAT